MSKKIVGCLIFYNLKELEPIFIVLKFFTLQNIKQARDTV